MLLERYPEGCGQTEAEAGVRRLGEGCWEGEKEWIGVQPGPGGGSSRYPAK